VTAYSEVLDRAAAMLGRTRRDPGLNEAYEQAEKLLVDAPCQLTAATHAVLRYQVAVRRFRGEEDP
jgi:uncharacterized protein (DUF1778 family)